jgi:hypothetical protein
MVAKLWVSKKGKGKNGCKPGKLVNGGMCLLSAKLFMISKEKIYQLIEACEDEGILEEVQYLLQPKRGDWWKDLPASEKEAVLTSLRQADEGKTISHQHLMAKI